MVALPAEEKNMFYTSFGAENKHDCKNFLLRLLNRGGSMIIFCKVTAHLHFYEKGLITVSDANLTGRVGKAVRNYSVRMGIRGQVNFFKIGILRNL